MTENKFQRALSALGIPLDRYVLVFLLPIAAGSILLSLVLGFLLPTAFEGMAALILVAIPILGAGGVAAYPFMVASQRGHTIDHNMHYFITHLGTLATSRVPPVQLFEQIGEKQTEYGPLAEECEKIASLVTDWNMGLSEACRFVAKRTPSEIFGDFLERFAFGLESGTEMRAYLKAEQEVVMADYEHVYKEAIQHIEDLKALFNGAMMTIIFMVMFALLMVILIDLPATLIMVSIIFVTFVVEGGFLMLANARVPTDPVWGSDMYKTPLWDRVKHTLPASVLASLVLGLGVLLLTDWSIMITIAIAAAPLIVPGYLATRAEDTVKRRDDSYPAFVRSLGSSTAARGGDERAVLRHLRHHDFGPLTQNIRDLFKRLQLRLDDEASWQYFTTEAGSRLVERFTQMYDEAVDTGGEPDQVGVIISDNMVRIIGLRKLRYQQAGTFRGTVFGVAAGAAFALFIGIGVLDMLTGLFTELPEIEESPVAMPSFLNVDAVDVPLLQILALIVLLVNAAMSSVLVRMVDGGSHVRDLEDFTLLVWISTLTAWGSWSMMTGFLGGNMASV